jgi:hypothetical protein
MLELTPLKYNWVKILEQDLRRKRTHVPLISLFVFLSLSGYPSYAVPGSGGQSGTKNPLPQSSSSKETPSAQSTSPAGVQPPNNKLLVVITDENNVPVPASRVMLLQTSSGNSWKGETDYLGQFEFSSLGAGLYQLRVEKEGFYVLTSDAVEVGTTQKVDVTLNHQQELHETMNVAYAPPAIDPTQTVDSGGLTGQQLIDLPYPTTRDLRQALPLIPGVLADTSGQIHVQGSATSQILDRLDGFNITQPVSGLLTMRVSADAVRSIDLQSSRYSAEFGKASGGILSLATGMGDDHFRFSATNFIPGLDVQNGIHLGKWNPRATFSGPIVKGKVWFFDSPDAEHDLNIVPGLPQGANQNEFWRWSNLLKTQVNLSPGNNLTCSLLLNHFHSPYAGLSQFAPVETTQDQSESTYLFTLKDQAYFSNGSLLEIGLGVSQFRISNQPQGNLPSQIHPDGTSGSSSLSEDGRARRVQWLANLNFPSVHWHGRHDFKVGSDVDWLTWDQTIERRPISIFREDGTLSQQITFVGNPNFTEKNFEVGNYAQDRWSISDRWLVEMGLRQDWDQIVRRMLFSPRLASSYLLTKDGRTKINAGMGLFYDATNLDIIVRPFEGIRQDIVFAADGKTPLGPPLVTSFLVNRQNLREPQFVNWSVGLERELPDSIYLSINFTQRKGKDGFSFVNTAPGLLGQPAGQFELTNMGRDRFDAIQINVRHTFKSQFPFLASYTRSSARSNAVIDFSLDNLIYSQQAGGPMPWDSPNRLLSWGGAPLWKGFSLYYSLDWRDGYPFNVINQDQQLVGSPGSMRFPPFFSLNVHMERRFHLLGYQLALRAGFNNITNHQNASSVINNMSSPHFLTFGDAQGRVLTARLRFLGKK